jgi:hypothetical protein
MKIYLFLFPIWLLLVFIFGGVGYALIKPNANSTLVENGVTTEGRVIAMEPDNHQLVHYSYNAGNSRYTGMGHAGGGNPRFRDLAVGQPVIVVYNPDNPRESFLGSPKQDVQKNLAGVVFFAFVPSTMIISIFGIGILISRVLHNKQVRRDYIG